MWWCEGGVRVVGGWCEGGVRKWYGYEKHCGGGGVRLVRLCRSFASGGGYDDSVVVVVVVQLWWLWWFSCGGYGDSVMVLLGRCKSGVAMVLLGWCC